MSLKKNPYISFLGLLKMKFLRRDALSAFLLLLKYNASSKIPFLVLPISSSRKWDNFFFITEKKEEIYFLSSFKQPSSAPSFCPSDFFRKCYKKLWKSWMEKGACWIPLRASLLFPRERQKIIWGAVFRSKVNKYVLIWGFEQGAN